MRNMWWNIYFLFATLFTILVLSIPLLIADEMQMAWWEWIYFPIYIIQIVGLFGFAFSKVIGVPKFWQTIFILSILYELYDIYIMIEDSGGDTILIAAASIGVLMQLPLLAGLYLYAYRCKQLWPHSQDNI